MFPFGDDVEETTFEVILRQKEAAGIQLLQLTREEMWMCCMILCYDGSFQEMMPSIAVAAAGKHAEEP